MNLNDRVGYRCPQLAHSGCQGHANYSLSVEDATHVLCVSPDVVYTSLAGQTDARIQGNRRCKFFWGCLNFSQNMNTTSSRDDDSRFN